MEHASSAVLRASSHLGSKNLSHGRPNSQSSRVMAEEPRLAPEACELHLACDEQSLGTVPKSYGLSLVAGTGGCGSWPVPAVG